MVARRMVALFLAAGISLWPGGARAHDASAWGGLFRSSDAGTTWFQASSGRIMGGALAVAVDPADSDTLLLGTDAGLLGTRNGGRDWDILAPNLLTGAVLAVAFDLRGQVAIAATGSILAVSADGRQWQSRLMPTGASPVRAIVQDAEPGAFYLVGWSALFHTANSGMTWSTLAAGLPGPVTQLVLQPGARSNVAALAAGRIWRSSDQGNDWSPTDSGLPTGQVEAVAIAADNSWWAAGANQLFRSHDAGTTWIAVGRNLPESDTRIWAISPNADLGRIAVTTDRGAYLSEDSGATWKLLADNLPGHIEAGPINVDARNSRTLYVGFSVTPYAEMWQAAASGGSALGRLSASEIAGAAAFLLLLVLASGLSLQFLSRRSIRPARELTA